MRVLHASKTGFPEYPALGAPTAEEETLRKREGKPTRTDEWPFLQTVRQERATRRQDEKTALTSKALTLLKHDS